MRYKFTILLFLALLSSQLSKAQTYVKEILHDKVPVAFTGKLIDAYEFKDAAGLHLYILTKTEETSKVSIFGFGYTQHNGVFVKDWEIRDFSDLGILLRYTYTKIIDIDKDGLLESIFVYQLDPDRGDGSTWKMMVHYKNVKYVFRVHVPELDEDEYSVKWDKSFETLPKSVRKYLIDYWNMVADKEDLKGRYVLTDKIK
ncbi:hypothetical protein KXD93_12570 [Mucilaginibacter sp. BJC16-A38]|uniref:M949_RS01915 family surface polysaccharide biosynthesis protein n=1 Tax=Mucilaginibacter phenanthrenivorans TaxID=1234842 RepID=UPI0021582113|nr:hypothetical protein [Mucilaginibacter phenanthrenivorans]MCR8558482.1 hypothetical protein [Mucilaginibacter phenanthrenivorans]